MQQTEAGDQHLGRSPAVAPTTDHNDRVAAVTKLKPAPPRWHNATPEEDYP
jgi:hypothetical protein